MQFTFLLHFIHFALSILAFLVVTHTAVILLDELVVALHQARVVSRDMMRLELIERYVGDLDDHLEPCAAVVIVHRHGDNIVLITDVLLLYSTCSTILNIRLVFEGGFCFRLLRVVLFAIGRRWQDTSCCSSFEFQKF